jgi:hypothetical protein
MDENQSSYHLGIFGRFILIIFVSFLISSLIVGSSFSNAFFYNIFFCFTVFIPILIIGFVIFILIQRTKYARYVTNRNVQIIALIISIFVIGNSLFFFYEWSPPSGIIDTWHCKEGQLLCIDLSNNCSRLKIGYDNTYAIKYGYLDFITYNYSGSFDFEWNFDKLTNIITIFYNNNSKYEINLHNPPLDLEWEVKLRIETIDKDKLLTYYISDVNAPFNAKLFNGITWFSI